MLKGSRGNHQPYTTMLNYNQTADAAINHGDIIGQIHQGGYGAGSGGHDLSSTAHFGQGNAMTTELTPTTTTAAGTPPNIGQQQANQVPPPGVTTVGHHHHHQHHQEQESQQQQHDDRLFQQQHDRECDSGLFPFLTHSHHQKGSENVKRFSVNNLLQLAQCANPGNLLTHHHLHRPPGGMRL